MHDSFGSRLSLCKPTDGIGRSPKDDIRSFRISDSEHRCEFEHLATQSDERASRQARADPRAAKQGQTSITVSPKEGLVNAADRSEPRSFEEQEQYAKRDSWTAQME